jgi:hypothetical protein
MIQTQIHLDKDKDGYGDPNISIEACSSPVGYVRNQIDCCDGDPDVNPMRSIKGELLEFEYGRNLLKTMEPSCYPYTSFDFLLERV